ncbi:type II toxin-antitoxin system HipA family toxin [Caulobacter sp. Root1472]|uniref:type II toxin-antitoxin system HipA family toxin n=1 Tax=Caulobacter sp. Root1472 TaxID=1736470 RepID=UPI0006FB2BD8|nr:type II toxin-antitoxin system HipA family toxin [Caulobacter sp. Root1472]KQZ22096.1 phosphatidylinositol kinase [Caulobacter sp. Root1472]
MSDDDVLVVWMDGIRVPAGYLYKADTGAIGFAYEQAYVEAGGLPLSLALPFDASEFPDGPARAFFGNLLPENTQLQRIMEREGLERHDVVGLLRHLGADCAGSVSCLPVDAPPVKTPGDLTSDYAILEDETLALIVKSLAEMRRLPVEVGDPSPVAGVQGKIALTRLRDGRFALPKSGMRVPTTHILKVPERGHGRDARLEEASALLAKAVGLDVSIPTAIKVGDYEALLIERFDRRVEGNIVTRIHQEDFAQALGFPSDLKYQRRGRPGRRFDVEAIVSVLDQTADPVGARLAFVTATLFNLCIGNTDNHAKNHGLLYATGATPRLTPLYDLLPIRQDNRYTHQLAFNIGAAEYFDKMAPEDMTAFLAAFGVEDVAGFVEEVVEPMVSRLEDATKPLRTSLKAFDDLIGQETEKLVDVFSVAIDVRERDAFYANPGGWGSGS